LTLSTHVPIVNSHEQTPWMTPTRSHKRNDREQPRSNNDPKPSFGAGKNLLKQDYSPGVFIVTHLLLLLLLIRSTTSLCIYGLLYHLLYVYLYDRWFPEPRG
jgi:hypothetical protein